jgi:hyperosmotically inducible protein
MRNLTLAVTVLFGSTVAVATLANAQFSQSILPLAMAQGTSADKSGQTRPVIDDREIALRVQSALFKDKRTTALGLAVKATDGTVELSGRADNQSQAERAVQVARAVPGVKSVTSEIRVN